MSEEIIDTTELKVIDRRGDYNMESAQTESSNDLMIITAMQKGYSPEIIEKMMALQERYEANEAKKAYYKAMSLFSQNAPEIVKDRQVSFGVGKTSYTHASLANVTNTIRAELGKHGLSPKWVTKQNEGIIKVTCTITHEQGYSEETSLEAAPDTSGSKNSIQAVGSTITYLERYTLLALTGLATKDMDNDGNGAISEPKVITEQQAIDLDKLLTNSGADAAKFLEYFEISKIQELKIDKYKEAVTFLNAKIANKNKK